MVMIHLTNKKFFIIISTFVTLCLALNENENEHNHDDTKHNYYVSSKETRVIENKLLAAHGEVSFLENGISSQNKTRFSRHLVLANSNRIRLQAPSNRADFSDNDRGFNLPDMFKRLFVKSLCNDKQNSTSMIFFSRPNMGVSYSARFDRFVGAEELLDSLDDFNYKNPTYLIIHGWYGCFIQENDYTIRIKDLILDKREANIFIVDWSHLAHNLVYERSVKDMELVADDVVEMLKNIATAFPGFKTNTIRLIGFSLGAHISGLVGRLMDGQLKQIIGLDPASVSITDLDPRMKLTNDDAKYVMAIHTNGAFYGTKMNVADHDIFVNGGLHQPFCLEQIPFVKNTCSHRAAPKIISAPIRGNCMIIAYRCFNWSDYSKGNCGYCKNSPNDCLSVASDWQYVDNDAYDDLLRRTQVSSTKKVTINNAWTLRKPDRRYYLKTSNDESQLCVFTYQVVVKFSENFNPSKDEEWSMDLVVGQGVKFPLSSFNKLKSNYNLTVYDDKSKTKKLTGLNIHVSLLTIGADKPIYKSMPMKINKVIMNMSKEDLGTEIYINYMSHISPDVRQNKSGRVMSINWNLINNPPSTKKQPEVTSTEMDRFIRRIRF